MIYCVEDERNIRELLIYTLETTGFQARGFETGKEFRAALEEELPELVLLDIMLPGEDGYTILEKLKSNPETRNIPVIMVTAKEAEYDKVRGLEGGADDYITKPYQAPVLLAHIRAVLRRTGKSGTMQEAELECRGVRLSLKDASVTFQGKRQELTKTELKLLHYLFSRQGEIVSREEIIDVLWDQHVFLDDNGLSVNITRIRNKLKALGAGPVIETKRGLGYLL